MCIYYWLQTKLPHGDIKVLPYLTLPHFNKDLILRDKCIILLTIFICKYFFILHEQSPFLKKEYVMLLNLPGETW